MSLVGLFHLFISAAPRPRPVPFVVLYERKFSYSRTAASSGLLAAGVQAGGIMAAARQDRITGGRIRDYVRLVGPIRSSPERPHRPITRALIILLL